MVLGPSESPGRHANLFKTANKKHSIYRKQELNNGVRPEVQFPATAKSSKGAGTGISAVDYAGRTAQQSVAQAADQLLLRDHTPPCVIVDKDGRILHIHGRTGKYLELSSGKPDLQVLNLAREGLRFPLSSSLRRASSSNSEIRQEGVRVKTNHDFQEISLRVTPLGAPPALKGTMMIIFEDTPRRAPAGDKSGKGPAPGEKDDDAVQRNIELEMEMGRLREDYRGALEELETSNEELKSVNEEMHSSNEELQSTNEELESSREELQSLNEEINTVNAQLNKKIEQLADSYAAVTEALNSTKIALLFLDGNLRVRRFTPEISELINLIDTDTGRSISHISHNLEIADLPGRVREVYATLNPVAEDVRTTDGHWYRMSIMADRRKGNLIEGTVLTFVNIDSQKEAQAGLARMKEKESRAAQQFSDNIVDTVRESLAVLDEDMRLVTANRRFYAISQLSPDQVKGKRLFELGGGQWDVPALRTLLETVIKSGDPFEDYLIEERFPNIGRRRMLLNARLIKEEEGNNCMILLAIDDVTDRTNERKEGT
jgi:two-component system CheB/CheR fusion protein